MAVSIDQQFIEYIVKSVVGHPDDVKIERRIDEKGVLLELSVNPEDLGRVIGKRGATAQSLRTLLRVLGTKNDARYNLKIIDTGPPPDRSQPVDTQKTDDTSTTADEPSTNDSASDNTAAPTSEESEPHTPDASDRDVGDDIDMTDDELPETASDLSSEASAKEEGHSDVVSRTRKELADLDDLDV